MPKIKNIVIFLVIGAVFVFIYFFYIKKSPDDTATLVSSPPVILGQSAATTLNTGPAVTQDFLNLLLNVKNIKLDDAIFSDSAFISLRDSSIVLTPDGNEGRPNPFAPLGTDVTTPAVPPVTTSPVTTPANSGVSNTVAPVTPAPVTP